MEKSHTLTTLGLAERSKLDRACCQWCGYRSSTFYHPQGMTSRHGRATTKCKFRPAVASSKYPATKIYLCELLNVITLVLALPSTKLSIFAATASMMRLFSSA